MRSIYLVMTVSLSIFSTPVWAGPNEGGVFILHANESIDYAPGVDYCGQSGLVDCSSADTRVDEAGPQVLHTFGAFPAENDPRVLAVVFGIEYDEEITVIDWGTCGDIEVLSGNEDGEPWPASGSVAVVGWNTAQTDPLLEIVWLAATNDAGVPASISIVRTWIDHSASFGDDSVPTEIDDAVDLGRLGFFEDGYLPCPDATPVQQSSWGAVKAFYR